MTIPNYVPVLIQPASTEDIAAVTAAVNADTTATQQVNTSVNAPAFGPAKDTSVNAPAYNPITILNPGLLAQDTSIGALHASGDTISQEAQSLGIPPAVPGTVGNAVILQGPASSPYTVYTFASKGKIWAASVSISIASSGGVGSNQAYARLYISGGQTLCYCEAAVVGNPSSGENGDSNSFPGLAAPSGTIILLDINNGTSFAGCVIRGGGTFNGSIP